MSLRTTITFGDGDVDMRVVVNDNPELVRRIVAMLDWYTASRPCAGCEHRFAPTRSDQKYCTARCRDGRIDREHKRARRARAADPAVEDVGVDTPIDLRPDDDADAVDETLRRTRELVDEIEAAAGCRTIGAA